jgi:hypothetical protein
MRIPGMNDNFKKKAWISFGVIFLSIAIASGTLYYFSNDLTAQTSKVVTDKALATEQQNAVGNLALLKAAEPQAKVYSAAIKQLLPDQYGVVGFGPWLDKVAQKYSVTDKFLFQGTPVQPTASSPGTYGFTLDVQGSPNNIELFLKDIESQSVGFLLNIVSFDLTNNQSSDNTGGHFSAQGVVFFR